MNITLDLDERPPIVIRLGRLLFVPQPDRLSRWSSKSLDLVQGGDGSRQEHARQRVFTESEVELFERLFPWDRGGPSGILRVARGKYQLTVSAKVRRTRFADQPSQGRPTLPSCSSIHSLHARHQLDPIRLIPALKFIQRLRFHFPTYRHNPASTPHLLPSSRLAIKPPTDLPDPKPTLSSEVPIRSNLGPGHHARCAQGRWDVSGRREMRVHGVWFIEWVGSEGDDLGSRGGFGGC